jgi:Ca-activated chloride channel family protein
MQRWLPWLFLLLFVQALHAQSRRITGVVLDGNTITSLHGVNIRDKTDQKTFTTDSGGRFEISGSSSSVYLEFQLPGYDITHKTILPHQDFSTIFLYKKNPSQQDQKGHMAHDIMTTGAAYPPNLLMPVEIKTHDNETYEEMTGNPMESASASPLSSFTLNANDAAYCNVRRFIMAKQLPPKEAVRIEEMINYFSYPDKSDTGAGSPMSLHTALTTCPWHPGDWLLRIAARAKDLPSDTVLPNNIVLLIDISGSMARSNKLPLLKKAFSVLANQLDPSDKISVVVYAGDVSVALPPTSGNEKSKILDVIHNLTAGGTTAGGAGIEKAFEFAKKNFTPHGNNRIIIATDGDFNVGKTSDEDMRKLVTKYHNWGIYLTCIGVGMGNYKDSKLETLAQWGQGNFVYIDDEEEALRLFNSKNYRKILISMAANARMKAIFNPELVTSYRLIGYENNTGGKRDSHAEYYPGGEIGYGQNITAFYELHPDPGINLADGYSSGKILATVALQYQTICNGKEHVLIKEIPYKVMAFKHANEGVQFAAAVTLFGMLLQQSAYTDRGNYPMIEKIIRHLKEKYNKNDRKAFLKLVQRAEHLPAGSAN